MSLKIGLQIKSNQIFPHTFTHIFPHTSPPTHPHTPPPTPPPHTPPLVTWHQYKNPQDGSKRAAELLAKPCVRG